jgi:hypothetical protein
MVIQNSLYIVSFGFEPPVAILQAVHDFIFVFLHEPLKTGLSLFGYPGTHRRSRLPG